ncbi:MAG: hypothetical protein IJ662_12040 [Clostridia bacterium]|nr:hypothetical protein [Clostridia bacterium]
MKKNAKVFIIKAKAANGNDRTVHAVTSLDVTLNDVIKAKNIPVMSIISTKVTAPMTLQEATAFTAKDYAALVCAPNTRVVKTTIG